MYQENLGCVVAFGDAMCASHQGALLERFKEFCRKKGADMLFATASPEFANLALKSGNCGILNYGKDLIFNPSEYRAIAKGTITSFKIWLWFTEKNSQKLLKLAADLKRNIVKARKDGLIVGEYKFDTHPDLELQNQIIQVRAIAINGKLQCN